MAILSCHVSIKLPPKISDGQENSTNSRVINAAKAEIARCISSRKLELGEFVKDTIIFGDKKGQKHPKGPLSGSGTTAWEILLMKTRPDVVNAFLAEYAPPILDPFCALAQFHWKLSDLAYVPTAAI